MPDDFGPAQRGRSRRFGKAAGAPKPAKTTRGRRGEQASRDERPSRSERRGDRRSKPGGHAGPPRRRRGRSVAGTSGKVLLTVLLAVLVLGIALVLFASLRLEREPVDGLASGGSPTHVLLVGSDSREDMTREQQNELTTGREGGNLADTILVASFQGGEAALLSFPRDLYVTRCDGSQGRVNAAYNIGGTGCLAQTVSNLSGLPIHHTMKVQFLGFRDIVDAVGGVEMCLDDPIRDAAAGIDLPAGCQTLDGPDALGYVRVRKIDSDFGRIERQQEFMRALAREVAEPATLANPLRWFQLANAGGSAVTASRSTGPIDLVQIGWGMRGLRGAPTYTVPGAPATIGGAAVLEPIQSEAGPLFDRFRTGAVLGETPDDAPTVAREDVAVAVLNGAGVEGLAGNVADELSARGFEIARVGNTDPAERTVIRHPAGQAEAAEVLASEVPTDVAIEEADVSTVTVVLGADLR